MYNTVLWPLLRSCFWLTTDLFGEIKQFQSPGSMVHVMHMLFKFFAVFKNSKSSFSEDNMPVHALDVFIEKATIMLSIITLNTKYEDRPLWYHLNFAFSYTM